MPATLMHGVARERLGQRTDDGDRTGDRRLEIQVDMGVLGGLGQLAGGDGHQRLVGGDHRLALLQRGQNGLACGFDRPHQFDDDVDVVTRHQILDVVGQHVDGHAAVVGDSAHPDAAQHHRCTDPRRQVLSRSPR